MPITYSIDHTEKLITEVWTGEVSSECLEAHWRKYLMDPDVIAIRRTLVDLRDAQITFTGSDLNSLIRHLVQPLLKGKDWTTAIVVERPRQFGVSRQYQVFADQFSQDAIFHDVAKARDWLINERE